ncbi:MAG: hemerythrin domain-containing protein [Pseudomonadota bacterium]|nr:hemerythrin domain-containing protein [Pseudomonadota bacterium]
MDITQLILDEHARQRSLFAQIEQIDAKDKEALSALWTRLRALLDSHAEAEEQFFYPRLMKIGKGGNDADSAAEETEDAIEDHNEIRDTAAAVDKEDVGSKAWFAAIGACNKANGDHMAEEERQGLTDFRQQASLQERHDLGVKFATFEAEHVEGVKPVDKDPKKWVRDHAPH